MTLKELMRLCFNAGVYAQAQGNDDSWSEWWEEDGKERWADFMVNERARIAQEDRGPNS